MLNRFISWIKGVFGIRQEDIKELGSNLVSPKMWAAITDWLSAYYNDPPWARKDMHLTKYAGVVTSYTSTLATNEVKLNMGDSPRALFIQDQIQRFFLSDIHNTVQKAMAGGYVVAKPYVYGSNIYTDIVLADSFFPTRIQGSVIEAGFFIDSAKVGESEYIRVENHDLQPDGVHITNKAYKANNLKQGREVPLSVVPQWEELAPEIIVEGVTSPLYAVLKTSTANQIDPTSKLPASMYANAMDSLKEMDRIYTEFLWEIHTGERKQIFDITALAQMPEESAEQYQFRKNKFQASKQYVVLNMNNPEKPYGDYTPEIRVEAYQKAMDIQLRLLEAQLALSSGAFTFDIRTGEAKTATEILSQDKTTYNTIKKIQENGLRQGLVDLIRVYDIYATLYKLAPSGNIESNVDFGDSIFEDTGIEFKRRMEMVGAEMLRPELLTSWYFGVSEDAAKEMMPDVVDVE